MAVLTPTGGATAQDEIARLLAEGYLRLLRQRAANCQSGAKIDASDSRESRCYGVAPE